MPDSDKYSEQPAPGPRGSGSGEDDYDRCYDLAMSCHRRGDNERAIDLLKAALELRPNDFAAVFNLGVILHGAGLKQDARQRLERALLLKPGNTGTLLALGRLLIEMGEPDAARQALQRVVDREPGNIDACLGLAAVEQSRGFSDKARQHYLQALQHHPGSGRLWHALSLHQTWTLQDEEIEAMQAALALDAAADSDRMLITYACAKMFDDLGDYERAFTCYRNANAMQAQQQTYDGAAQQAFFERHKTWQSANKLEALAPAAIPDATPIFIMGMPRSGTSLVEQMLDCHPSVVGAGEVDFSRLLVDACMADSGRPFPEEITRVEPRVMADAASRYVERLRCSVGLPAGGVARVVDKLPHNFLRTGLLTTLLPNAGFVLCEREPLDVCLSIYRQNFSADHGYACDLRDLGAYYRCYQDLVSFWEEQFPGRLYRLSYEELVRDTPGQLRRLLAHLGLPYDEACLSFHNHSRWVATPSAAQVRRPVYAGAIGHWRHYDAWLDPLRVALAGDRQ